MKQIQWFEKGFYINATQPLKLKIETQTKSSRQIALTVQFIYFCLYCFTYEFIACFNRLS